MHTFLVLLPTAHFAANACWRFEMQLRLLAAVYILHDRCCLCMTTVTSAFHMICLQYTYTVWAWQGIFVHGRWHVHVSCTCICCMYMTAAGCAWIMLYMHDIWYMCGTTYECTLYNVQLYIVKCSIVHGRWDLCITDDVCMTATCLCMTAAVCPWLLLSVHDKSCTICGLSFGEVYI